MLTGLCPLPCFVYFYTLKPPIIPQLLCCTETSEKVRLDRLAEERFRRKDPTTKPDNRLVCNVYIRARGSRVEDFFPQ